MREHRRNGHKWFASVKPEDTRVLARGNWMDESGEVVQPAIPGFLGKLETGGRRATRLDLANWRWERLTERRWTQFYIGRADRRPNQLWRVNSLWTLRGGRWAAEHRESMETMIRGQIEELTAAYGVAPDVELFGALFRPSIPHEQLPDVETEFGARRIKVDGVVVRYVEEANVIHMIVEGELPASVVGTLVADLRSKLARLENTEYVVRQL